MLVAVPVWPLVHETWQLLRPDQRDEGERQVRSAVNEVGGVLGVAGYSSPRFWMRDKGAIVGNLRIRPEPWFVQAFTPGGRKGWPSRLDGVRETVEHVLKAKIHALDEVVIWIE